MMQSRLGRDGEFSLIRRILQRSGVHALETGLVSTGPGDDCAVVAGGVALSVDMSVEGIHFRREWMSLTEIGYRAAAAALSDLAAMAAQPIGTLVSIAVPSGDGEGTVLEIMDGVDAVVAAAGGMVLGGDLTRVDGSLVVDVVAVGRTDAPILRSGARPGDVLWVTGLLGAPAAAITAWKAGMQPHPDARAAFVRPEPRIQEALWLARTGALSAMIDLSDGLAGDARHIAAASGIRIVLDAARVPVSPAASSFTADAGAALHMALTGGEDYELCFAASPGSIQAVEREFESAFNLTLSQVGTISEGAGVALLQDVVIHELADAAHDHFRRTDP